MEARLKKLNRVESLVLRRRWILGEIKRFEAKYGMSSSEFIEKWRRGVIPEPDDPEVHGDFMVWQGLIEELNLVEKELENYF
ncbi:MAG: hypothetical protein F7B59_05545 [Desulfurococcales archaeon]|nr:hypothetical protein [Desulfurococcales archaeon]